MEGKKVLVVGIDGVPYTLVREYVERGYMPHLKAILEEGYKLHQMDASLPDISSVSWTTFLTGVNPAEHSIYGFIHLDRRDYSLRFPNSGNVMAPTFFQILGLDTAGKSSSLANKYLPRFKEPRTSIVVNVPHTYPAYPMNGVLVSGFVALDLARAVYPPVLASTLKRMGYVIDVDPSKGHRDRAGFLEDLFHALDKRREAFDLFFKGKWDLFVACITETDRLHHFFFDAALDEAHPYHGTFVDFYKKLDDLIGHLYDMFLERHGGQGFFMILSDHGFATLRKEVNINRFLEEAGFLKLKEEGERYERIALGTKAFALDPCRVYLHYKDQYPLGEVGEGEAESHLEELTDLFRNLRNDDGSPIIRAIYRKEEIYQGPFLDDAPDLLCLPVDGYDLKGRIGAGTVFADSVFAGMHNQHDAMLILPEEKDFGDKPQIGDLAGLLLDHFCGEDL